MFARGFHKIIGWKALSISLLVTLLVGLVCVVASYHGSGRQLTINVMYAVPPAVVTLLCFLAARQGGTRRVTLFWLLIGAAHLCIALAQASWAWLEVIYPQGPPFPSVADAFWLGLYPFAFAGLVVLVPSGGKRWRSAAASLLDGLLFGLAAGAMVWQFVSPPPGAQVGLLTNVVVAAYPTGDILLLMGLVSLGLLPPAAKRLPRGAAWLALSIFITVCADVLYASHALSVSSRSGGWVGLLWPLAYTLVALSAIFFLAAPRHRPERPPKWFRQWLAQDRFARRLAQLRLALPYLVVPIVAELLLLQFISDSTTDVLGNVAKLAVTLLLVVLVLGRQLLVVVENEQRVVAQIDRLSEVALEKSRLAALNKLASAIGQCASVGEVARKGLELSLEVMRCTEGGMFVSETACCRSRFFGSAGLSRADRLRLVRVARELAARDGDSHAKAVSSDSHGTIVVHAGDGPGQFTKIALAPLISKDGLMGVLCLGIQGEERVESDLLRNTVWSVAGHLAVAIENARHYEEARYLAERDTVTGLLNRRGLDNRIEEELTRSRRSETCFAVVMMDLDNFKLINDTHGHAVGDEVLVGVSRLLVASVRRSDVVGRYGGDEFLALLPSTDTAEALSLVDRVQQAVGSLALTVQGDFEISPGMSYGIATWPFDGRTAAEILAVADENLYHSKQCVADSIIASHLPKRVVAVPDSTLPVLRGLVNAVAVKDHYTVIHSEEVSAWSTRLARALELPYEMQRSLRIAGWLHDVGKLGIPSEVLLKPCRLTAREYEIVKQHVALGEEIVRQAMGASEVVEAVASHHERWDGAGYPRGKKGTDIPLLGRILAVCDAYVAMTSQRPYRGTLTLEQAEEELRRVAESQLDPGLVDLLLKVLRAKGFVEADFSARETAPSEATFRGRSPRFGPQFS